MKIPGWLIGLLIFILPLQGQNSALEAGGYIKSLSGYSRNMPFVAADFAYQELQARVNIAGYLTENNTIVAEGRIRMVKSKALSLIPGYKASLVNTYPLGNLSMEIYNQGDGYAFAQPDRLNWTYDAENWQLTVGRQRVSWGTTLVWNVTDLFNPQSILDFDYEERPGSDVLRFQYFTGPASHIEGVWLPARDKNKRVAAIKTQFNRMGYDVYIMAAWQRSRPVMGAAFSGDVFGGGLRGELKWSAAPQAGTPVEYAGLTLPPLADGRRDDWQWALSYDFLFSNNVYLHFETLYNSLGVNKYGALYQYQALRSGLLNASQWSLFGEWSWQWHPLSKVDMFALVDAGDGSFILVPSFNWSATDNLDVFLIALVGRGEDTTTYGALGESFYLRIKYSFYLNQAYF